VALRYPPYVEIAADRGAKVWTPRLHGQDYTAIWYVGRHTYQARQAADMAFDEMPNCAITSALAGGELDCRAGRAGHLMEPMSMGLIIHAAIEKSR
jgi:hypothetical protein